MGNCLNSLIEAVLVSTRYPILEQHKKNNMTVNMHLELGRGLIYIGMLGPLA